MNMAPPLSGSYRPGRLFISTSKSCKERIFIEHMTSGRKLKVPREGSKSRIYGT